jgi:hypothetical protein
MTSDLAWSSRKKEGPNSSSPTYGIWRVVINVVLYFVVVPSAYNLALAIEEAPVVNWEYWFYGYAFGFLSWVWGLVLVPALFGVDRATRSLSACRARWCITGTAALLNTAVGGGVFRTPFTTIVMGASGLIYGLVFRMKPRPYL